MVRPDRAAAARPSPSALSADLLDGITAYLPWSIPYRLWVGPRYGASMDARELLTRLCAAIDAHAWDRLAPLLHPGFTCRYVHTGETFDRAAWIRLNAEYPEFDRLALRELVADGDRAAARCHVTAVAGEDLTHFEVASFATARDGLLLELTEVWTDVHQATPVHRPT